VHSPKCSWVILGLLVQLPHRWHSDELLLHFHSTTPPLSVVGVRCCFKPCSHTVIYCSNQSFEWAFSGTWCHSNPAQLSLFSIVSFEWASSWFGFDPLPTACKDHNTSLFWLVWHMCWWSHCRNGDMTSSCFIPFLGHLEWLIRAITTVSGACWHGFVPMLRSGTVIIISKYTRQSIGLPVQFQTVCNVASQGILSRLQPMAMLQWDKHPP